MQKNLPIFSYAFRTFSAGLSPAPLCICHFYRVNLGLGFVDFSATYKPAGILESQSEGEGPIPLDVVTVKLENLFDM